MPQRRTLEKELWRSYLERVTFVLREAGSDIELSGSQVGKGMEEHQRLIAITYYPIDDLLELACQRLDHLIRSPRSLAVVEDGRRLRGLEVEEQSGKLRTVTFIDPPRLAA